MTCQKTSEIKALSMATNSLTQDVNLALKIWPWKMSAYQIMQGSQTQRIMRKRPRVKTRSLIMSHALYGPSLLTRILAAKDKC